MKIELLKCFDPLFADSFSIFCPRRWSEHFKCFFPALLETADEVAEKIDQVYDQAKFAKSIIRNRCK